MAINYHKLKMNLCQSKVSIKLNQAFMFASLNILTKLSCIKCFINSNSINCIICITNTLYEHTLTHSINKCVHRWNRSRANFHKRFKSEYRLIFFLEACKEKKLIKINFKFFFQCKIICVSKTYNFFSCTSSRSIKWVKFT
jgi:hypothetical protein